MRALSLLLLAVATAPALADEGPEALVAFQDAQKLGTPLLAKSATISKKEATAFAGKTVRYLGLESPFGWCAKSKVLSQKTSPLADDVPAPVRAKLGTTAVVTELGCEAAKVTVLDAEKCCTRFILHQGAYYPVTKASPAKLSVVPGKSIGSLSLGTPIAQLTALGFEAVPQMPNTFSGGSYRVTTTNGVVSMVGYQVNPLELKQLGITPDANPTVLFKGHQKLAKDCKPLVVAEGANVIACAGFSIVDSLDAATKERVVELRVSAVQAPTK
jgi:hypothetical protein